MLRVAVEEASGAAPEPPAALTISSVCERCRLSATERILDKAPLHIGLPRRIGFAKSVPCEASSPISMCPSCSSIVSWKWASPSSFTSVAPAKSRLSSANRVLFPIAKTALADRVCDRLQVTFRVIVLAR